jgi:hypothetical protein
MPESGGRFVFSGTGGLRGRWRQAGGLRSCFRERVCTIGTDWRLRGRVDAESRARFVFSGTPPFPSAIGFGL